ncbi:MAG TPA: flagella basal body P-ring formation protein FlgA [Terracidiphilus sp.]
MIPVPGECYGSAAQTERQGKQESRRSSQPIIHAGDSVIVIEETPSLDASYEGVALSAAQSGEPVNIRLKIGGRALQAVATARGRARLVAKAIEAH